MEEMLIKMLDNEVQKLEEVAYSNLMWQTKILNYQFKAGRIFMLVEIMNKSVGFAKSSDIYSKYKQRIDTVYNYMNNFMEEHLYRR